MYSLNGSLPSPLISGVALEVTVWRTEDGKVLLSGPTWQGSISTVGDLFRFEVELSLSEALAVTPEILLWLGPFNLMDDRQALTWRRTLVPGPTANGQGLPGNDLPAAYLYDPVRKVETVFAVDAGAMAWAPGRLLGYRCTERYDEAGGRCGVGLVRTGGALTLPAGRHHFVWYLWQGPRASGPDAWTGLQTLVEKLAPLLDVAVEGVAAGTWRDRAAGCVQDLADEDACWISVDGAAGLRAYVKNTSRYFGEAGRNFFELMTQMDVLPPLLLYQRLHPTPEGALIRDKLLRTLPLFHQPEIGWMVNSFPDGSTVADLWYPFENSLIKLGWVVAATGDAGLKAIWQSALAGATRLAHQVGYQFPLFCETATGEALGSCPNVSVGGLYAYGHVQAWQMGLGEEHRQEALATLKVMRRMPLELQYHEPQQLGFAAAAAAVLGERALARDFLNAQLRMAYWFTDGGTDVRGMFQACASLLYPAFKENVEALLPWSVLLGEGVGDPRLLLRIIALQRRNNLAYFDADAAPFIPYENLGTPELPQRGVIGKEIYGAGEVLWLYLMTEAYGVADDPDILAVCLDVLTASPGAWFFLFNPTDTTRTFRFVGAEYTLLPGAYVSHHC